MSNFTAKVRVDYRDIDSLVLDCRDTDLPLNIGSHTGSNNASVLSDSTKAWSQDSLVGGIVYNLTDGSSGVITANTSNTVTAVLAGGAGNDWDTSDAYAIMPALFEWINRAPAARPEFAGSHSGSAGTSVVDTSKNWRVNQLIGCVIWNVTAGTYGSVVSNGVNSVSTSISWTNGDTYLLYTPRFGNPFQDTVANCPIVTESSGRKIATFTKALSHFLKIPLEYRMPTSYWTVAFELTKGIDTTAWQAVVSLESGSQDFTVYRLMFGGNFGFRATNVTITGSGDLPDDISIFAHHSAIYSKIYNNGVVILTGNSVAFDVLENALATYSPGRIGSRVSDGTAFCDMVLRNVRIWNRMLSPLEIDFAFQTLQADGTDNSVLPRVPIQRTIWTDEVSDYSRVNATQNAPQRYNLGSLMSGNYSRVQVAAQVGGKTLADADLGGKLFTIEPIEIPDPTNIPTIFQESGWSSVFDIRCSDEGHYTYLLSRADGGAIYLHWDIEVDIP